MEFEQLVDTFRMKTSSDGDGVLTWPFSQGLVQIWTRFGQGLVRFGCGLVEVWFEVWFEVQFEDQFELQFEVGFEI